MSERKILLIDGSSLVFRAFYSILDLNRFQNQSGLHTNALFSFNRMLNNVLAEFEPTHVLVAFDKSGKTFRHKEYAQYKAGRSKTPSELKEQLPYFRVLLDGYGIKHYDLLEYEADDIIGTLSTMADEDDEVVVLSGDKDLMQLASDNTTVYITRRGISDLEAYTPENIEKEYALTPRQLIDLMGLMGDPSDNIPGVTRIGEKTGLKLLHEYHSLEELYERLDELNPTKMKENLLNEKDMAFLSRDLATIKLDTPLDFDIEDLEMRGKDPEALGEFYRQMNFNSFIQDLQEEFPGEVGDDSQVASLPEYTLERLETIEAQHLPSKSAYLTEVFDENYHFSPVTAVAWADREAHKVYVATPEVAFTSAEFKAWLADESQERVYYDFKASQVVASHYGAYLEALDADVLIATYLIDTQYAKELSDITQLVGLPTFVERDEQVYGKGARKQVPEDQEVLDTHLKNKLVAICESVELLEERLEEDGMLDLYHDLELPAAKVLAAMEIRGLSVDAQAFKDMNEALSEQLASIEARIYDMAGETFNINSPAQLGVILFENLKLPVIRRTKTGYSTAADVLEKLQDEHPIIDEILEYRTLAKLQGTYLKGMPRYIQEDGKIHTIFVQTLTQTGRLSSMDPNLQNIPVRLEEGRKVRKAFVPSQKDWQLFSADYSQIELRVLADISGDEHLRQAFIDGEDIHASTAARVFGVESVDQVDETLRDQAKAVNFGIVYGMSDYGLSQNLGISRAQAKDFIDRYFATYPGVNLYMKDIVKQAKSKGYVSTMFNRRRYLPDINASNFNLRSFAERTAINSPIQGTAADIIKVAMNRLDAILQEKGLQSRLLLQVHDELILEGPAEEMKELEVLVPEIMEHAVELSIPLKVDYGIGHNWYEL